MFTKAQKHDILSKYPRYNLGEIPAEKGVKMTKEQAIAFQKMLEGVIKHGEEEKYYPIIFSTIFLCSFSFKLPDFYQVIFSGKPEHVKDLFAESLRLVTESLKEMEEK